MKYLLIIIVLLLGLNTYAGFGGARAGGFSGGSRSSSSFSSSRSSTFGGSRASSRRAQIYRPIPSYSRPTAPAYPTHSSAYHPTIIHSGPSMWDYIMFSAIANRPAVVVNGTSQPAYVESEIGVWSSILAWLLILSVVGIIGWAIWRLV